MFTIGGVEMFDASSGEVETKDMPHDVNRGRHILHTGGCFDGYLYLSVPPTVIISDNSFRVDCAAKWRAEKCLYILKTRFGRNGRQRKSSSESEEKLLLGTAFSDCIIISERKK